MSPYTQVLVQDESTKLPFSPHILVCLCLQTGFPRVPLPKLLLLGPASWCFDLFLQRWSLFSWPCSCWHWKIWFVSRWVWLFSWPCSCWHWKCPSVKIVLLELSKIKLTKSLIKSRLQLRVTITILFKMRAMFVPGNWQMLAWDATGCMFVLTVLLKALKNATEL